MRDATGTAHKAWGVPVPPTRAGDRSAANVTPLIAFADEADALAATTSDARFQGSDRYVADMDELRRRLRDMADRMRRAASVKPNDRPFGTFGHPISGGREVTVVRARRKIGVR